MSAVPPAPDRPAPASAGATAPGSPAPGNPTRERFGVDVGQWKTLTRLFLRLDFRGMNTTFNRAGGRGQSPWAMVVTLLFYALTGFFLAVLLAPNPDLLFTGTVLLTYLMFMLGAVVLMELHVILLSPDEYGVLGYRPVSARTWFAAKLSSFSAYVFIMTGALGLGPIAVFFVHGGFTPLVGLAGLAAFAACGMAVSLTMALAYSEVLRLVPPRKLRAALSYLQIALSIVIYGGYAIIPDLMKKGQVAHLSLPQSPWIFLHPATWFASYLELAQGRFEARYVLAALASVAAVALLFRIALGKASMGYSERVASLTGSGESRRKARAEASGRPSLFFRKDEGRAIALLIRNQFKYDQRFRMVVLGIIPLTLLYLVMGLREGPILDPFVLRAGGREGVLLYFAVLLFPMLLSQGLAASEAYTATWIYFATPSRPERLVLAARNYVMAYFVVPYLLVMTGVFSWLFHNVLHAAVHMLVLGLVTLLFFEAMIAVQPVLPFSKPPRRGERSARLMATWFAMMIFGGAFVALGIPFLRYWVYRSPWRIVLAAAVLAGAAWGLDAVIRVRVRREQAGFFFAG